MTDTAFDELVADALAQAPEIAGLDGARAEAWAGDLLALAAELGDGSGSRLVDALLDAADDRAATALHAVGALRPGTPAIGWSGEPPVWRAVIGTSRCEGAVLVRARGATSAVFRFVDAADDRHVISVDLLADRPGAAEEVGEVALGGGDLLDGLAEDDAGAETVEIAPGDLAARVAAALVATTHPRASAVAHGRLLSARLGHLTGADIAAPQARPDDVPDPPTRDPAADARAIDVLRRALGPPLPPEPDALAEAAATLRRAVGADEPLSAWLAASIGPTDADQPDYDLVVAALTAPIAPASLEPLPAAARDAVLVLEGADWLGAVIEVVRRGRGASVDGRSLVEAVNRCPEVDSVIPKRDRARIAWAFDRCTEVWNRLGVAVGGRLTLLGVALLPAALERAWGQSSSA